MQVRQVRAAAAAPTAAAPLAHHVRPPPPRFCFLPSPSLALSPPSLILPRALYPPIFTHPSTNTPTQTPPQPHPTKAVPIAAPLKPA